MEGDIAEKTDLGNSDEVSKSGLISINLPTANTDLEGLPGREVECNAILPFPWRATSPGRYGTEIKLIRCGGNA